MTGLLGELAWYAVHVRSRHEKVVARELASRRISYWLPMIERKRRWSDRYVTIADVLFPGYLFVNIDYDDRVTVVEARGVVRIVGFNGKPCPVPAEQIEAVRAALRSSLRVDPYPHLRVGMPVEVVRGPLKGFCGDLIEKNRKYRVVLSISLIAQSVAVEVDASDVQPA